MLMAAIVGLGWWGKTFARMLADNPKIRLATAVTRSAEGARQIPDDVTVAVDGVAGIVRWAG